MENENKENEVHIEHDPVGQKFTALIGSTECILAYTEVNDMWDIFELAVPEEMAAAGIAEKLVMAAFEYAKASRIRIIPSAAYIKDIFLKEHPEFRGMTAGSFF